MERKIYFLFIFYFLGFSLFAQSQKSILQKQVISGRVTRNISAVPQQEATEAESLGLQRFGTQIFENNFTAPAGAGGLISVSDYILGPGDHLGVFFGGKAQQYYDVIISSDNKIYIPTVGVLSVYKQTIKQFEKYLDQKLEPYYSNYNVDVILLAPKNIRIGVAGEVNAPGDYTVSGSSTVLDVLLYAKSPTEKGSLRDIQIFRNDSLIYHIDLYDFLLKPKGRHFSIFLQNGDRIFVPIIKSVVEISGEINRPAIYELNPNKEERISDIIAIAGNLTDLAFLQRIEFSRMKENGERKISYFDFNQIKQADSLNVNKIMQNNDRLFIYSKLNQLPEEVVHIHGEVTNPGEYYFEENMRLCDLILKAGSLTRQAYLLQAEIAKVNPKEPVKVNKVILQQALKNPDSDQNQLLEVDDHVFIRRIPEWQVGPLVEVRGEVCFPGYYPIVKDSTKLEDIIKQAGGLTDDAHINEAKLVRKREPMVEDKEYERLKAMNREEMSDLEYEYLVMKENTADIREIVVDFYDLLIRGNQDENVVLEEGDVITIPKQPNVVLVTGRVSNPGGILYKENADLRYYINKAGGYSWDSAPKKTKVIKVTGEIKDDEDVDEFAPGDRIWVPRKPDRNYWQIFRDTILVAGQIAAIFLVIQNAVD